MTRPVLPSLLWMIARLDICSGASCKMSWSLTSMIAWAVVKLSNFCAGPEPNLFPMICWFLFEISFSRIRSGTVLLAFSRVSRRHITSVVALQRSLNLEMLNVEQSYDEAVLGFVLVYSGLYQW